MEFQTGMLEMLVCPQCGGSLHYTKEEVLFCVRCRVCFSVNDGIPDLNPANAFPISVEGKPMARLHAAFFTIEEGPDAGIQFRVEQGSCKVLGRKVDDPAKTQLFNIDFTMSLDDHTKQVIFNYLSKTTGQKKKGGAKDLGHFRRLPDLILNDLGVSRLHAMIFYDESSVGILDLVSRNGTFVNGKEIEAILLKGGDEIKMGGTRMTFVLK